MMVCAAAVVAAALVWKFGMVREKYVATGTFYYWHHGLEMSAGRSDWGGPSPIGCFKTDVWEQRPTDFYRDVWRKFQGLRDWQDDAKPKFMEAYESVTFGGNGTALTWQNLYAASSDPVLAADVANACLEALAELEEKLLKEKREKSLGWLAAQHFRYCRTRDKLQEDSPKRERIEKEITKTETSIGWWEGYGVRTNTMFKIMRRADVPTKTGEPSEARLRKIARGFDALGKTPF